LFSSLNWAISAAMSWYDWVLTAQPPLAMCTMRQ
jgi:hypothetical protein